MDSDEPRKRFDWGELLLLCVIYLVLTALWNTVWVYPLKLFVVLLHEVSHALVAVATGGRIQEIRVFRDEGGLTVTAGGNKLLVTSAGYLGSLTFGALILLVSTRTSLSRWFAALLGAGAVILAVRFMPDDGRVFAVVCGVALAALAAAPHKVPELALRVIGVCSCLYAILDIKSDVLDRRDAPSDAAAMAAMTHIPSVVWGALWIAVSVVVTFYALRAAVTTDGEAPVGSRES
jgi:hypothetical protein